MNDEPKAQQNSNNLTELIARIEHLELQVADLKYQLTCKAETEAARVSSNDAKLAKAININLRIGAASVSIATSRDADERKEIIGFLKNLIDEMPLLPGELDL